MTAAELVKALNLEGELAETLKKEFNAKDKELTAKDKEINTLKKTVESSQKEKEELTAVKEKLSIIEKGLKLDINAEDLDKEIDNVKESLSKFDSKGTEDYKELSRELTKVNRELDKTKKDLEEANTLLATEKAERVKGLKNTEILKELQANRVIKAEQWVGRFFNEVTVSEDNTSLYMLDSAGKEVSLKDGIADWAKENPEFIKVETKGGAGSGLGGNSKEQEGELSGFMKSLIGESQKPEGQKSLGEMFG